MSPKNAGVFFFQKIALIGAFIVFFLISCSNSNSFDSGDDELDSGVELDVFHESSSSKGKSGGSSSQISESSSSKGKSGGSSSQISESSSSKGKSEESSSKTSESSSSAKSSCSSKEENSSSSYHLDWSVPKKAYLNPDVQYDSMVDSRDGKVYKTVKIGNKTWMAENLNYADSVATPNLVGRSSCYDNKPEKCDVAGRIYTWLAAYNIEADSCNNKKCVLNDVPLQGICPNGWHMPSMDEWESLIREVGGEYVAHTALKSQVGWPDSVQGSDDYGFSVLPGGYRDYNNGAFMYDGLHTIFWTQRQYDSWSVMRVDFSSYRQRTTNPDPNAVVSTKGTQYKTAGSYVRCVQGTGNPSSLDTVKISSSSSSINYDSLLLIMYESCREYVWRWDLPIDAYLSANAAYDSITDERDGRIYKTIKIGKQEWMAENLKYADSVETPSLKGRSKCYKQDSCNLVGHRYTWAAAIDSVKLAIDEVNPQICGYDKTCTLRDTVYGICPKGWHLPSQAEWEDLFRAVNRGDPSFDVWPSPSEKLKSSRGWNYYGFPGDYDFEDGNGSNRFGFSAIPNDGDGYSARFWSSTEVDEKKAYSLLLDYVDDESSAGGLEKQIYSSIRCLRNVSDSE